MTQGMDTIGWYVATMHALLGHDKAAAALGQPPYDKNVCILCAYERGEVTKDQVVDRIGSR